MNVQDTGVTGLTDGWLSPVLCTAWVHRKATPRARGSLRGWADVAVTAEEAVTAGGMGSTGLRATYVACVGIIPVIVTICGYIYVCSVHVVVTMYDSIFVLGEHIEVTIGGYIGVCSVGIIVIGCGVHSSGTMCGCICVCSIHIIVALCGGICEFSHEAIGKIEGDVA